MRGVFGDVRGSTAILAAKRQPLQQTQRNQDGRGEEADLVGGRQHADDECG